ncbi:elongator complex protein 2 [Trichinella spiralis]|uniref:elongator complex protein 2 n=1 Tax=Trichinella spiralis TaxID=6334 RepID=UPI0001EFCC5A|nr:elongator complex protein 2 [Trichinella spiralis]
MHGKQVGRSPEKKGGTQKFTGSGTSSATALKNCSIVRIPPSYSAVSHGSMRCCSQNRDDLYLHASNYSYFDYLKPNANCQQGEKMNQSEFKHREEKSGKMVKMGFDVNFWVQYQKTAYNLLEKSGILWQHLLTNGTNANVTR